MILRDFVASDWEIYRDFSKDFYSGGATLHSIGEENMRATFQAVCDGTPYARGVIIEQQGKPAGYVLLSFTWSNEAGGEVVILEELYVAPEFRGQKMGSAVMDWLTDTYGQKAMRLRLEVCKENVGAMHLYEKKGFTRLDYIQMVRDK